MLQNEDVVANIGVDKTENGPRKGLQTGTIEEAPAGIEELLGQRCPQGRISISSTACCRGMVGCEAQEGLGPLHT